MKIKNYFWKKSIVENLLLSEREKMFILLCMTMVPLISSFTEKSRFWVLVLKISKSETNNSSLVILLKFSKITKSSKNKPKVTLSDINNLKTNE